MALECGMTAYEFWYEDPRLFESYFKAYHARIDKEAWLNGLYVFEAVSCAINNVMPSAIGRAFSKKGKSKPMYYHDKPLGAMGKPTRTRKAAPKTANEASGVAFWAERIKQLKGMER